MVTLQENQAHGVANDSEYSIFGTTWYDNGMAATSSFDEIFDVVGHRYTTVRSGVVRLPDRCGLLSALSSGAGSEFSGVDKFA